jgi:hypothetical protein
MCGSIFLDENFVKYMEDLLGKDKLRKLSKEDYTELMAAWEHKVKRLYENNRTEITARIPHSVAKAIDRPLKKLFRKDNGRVRVTGDMMRFAP